MNRLIIVFITVTFIFLSILLSFGQVNGQTYPTETSWIGVQLVKKSEGLRLCTYIDDAGYPTVGFGHKLTVNDDLPNCITPTKAGELLKRDLRGTERVVNTFGQVVSNQGRFDALTSLIFNIGGGTFGRSKAHVNLVREDIPEFKFEAFDSKMGFVKDTAGGRILTGLVIRRQAESYLFGD